MNQLTKCPLDFNITTDNVSVLFVINNYMNVIGDIIIKKRGAAGAGMFYPFKTQIKIFIESFERYAKNCKKYGVANDFTEILTKQFLDNCYNIFVSYYVHICEWNKFDITVINLDYEFLRHRIDAIREPIIAWVFHPSRIEKWLSMDIDIIDIEIL
jgi:hypothetical protein